MIPSKVSDKFLFKILILDQIFGMNISSEISDKLLLEVIGNLWFFKFIIRSPEVPDQLFFKILILH